jgi:hypothetical protein
MTSKLIIGIERSIEWQIKLDMRARDFVGHMHRACPLNEREECELLISHVHGDRR